MEDGLVPGVQALEQLPLDRVSGPPQVAEQRPSGRGQPDGAAAAVGRVAVALDQPTPVEQVEHRHRVARVDPDQLAEAPLVGDAQVVQHHEHPEVVGGQAVVGQHPRPAPDGLGVTLATNHLAPFRLSNLLLDLLGRSAPARVITVGSDQHKRQRSIPWDDLEHGRDCTYNTSKLLNVLFTAELARRLAGTGVTANCLSPGFVRTGLGRDATGAFRVFLRLARPFQASPEAGADTPVYLATAPEVAEVSGGYFVRYRPAAPSALARDPAAAERLWRLSARLTGLDAGPPPG